MADQEAAPHSSPAEESSELMTELDGSSVHPDQQSQGGGLSPSLDNTDAQDVTNSNLHYGSEDHANVETESEAAGPAATAAETEIERAGALRSARLNESEQLELAEGEEGQVSLVGSGPGGGRGSARGRADAPDRVTSDTEQSDQPEGALPSAGEPTSPSAASQPFI